MTLRFSPARGAASLVLNAVVRGPQGTAATLTAGTATTLAAGASATVANSGTTSDAVFDIGIPRGADSGMRYAFESSTSMAAPASGGIRLNNATLSSVTAIAVNATNSDGVDVSDFIVTWDDSTNTNKGTLVVRKEASGAVLGVFTITSVTDNTTWLQFAVTYVSGSGALAATNPVYLTANITGNKGADGTMTGPGVSVDNEIALYNGTGGATLKRASNTGILKATSGVIGTAVAGTDYAAATSGSSILKGNGAGGTTTATAGTDYYNPGGTDVAVADGGTGSSTAAGAATNLGLGTANNPQFATVELGAATDTTISRASAGVIAVEGISLYSGIPLLSKSTAYTTVLGDANTGILHPTADNNARTFTIDSNANVAYPVNTTLTFVNQINTVTIAITSDTLTLLGAGSTGSRTLAAAGMATALKVSSTGWVISGVGLT